MSGIGQFQIPGEAGDVWVNALVERQADSASHPELEPFGYINASAFSWNKDDLTSLSDIIESAQSCGAITGPAPLWCQLRLHPTTSAPLLRIGINVGEFALTNEQEMTFVDILRTDRGLRARGTWLLVWTVATILKDANTLWQRWAGAQGAADKGTTIFDPQEDKPADVSELRRWAAHAAQALIEVRAGRRPARQLRALASQRALADITRWATASQQPLMTITSVHVSQPTATTAEVAVILTCGGRGHAIALRLEAPAGKWQIARIVSDERRGT